MKRFYIFLVFIICIWSGFAENIYYVEKDGTVLNLGKNEEASVINGRDILENGGKFYVNGKENKTEGEKYKAAVMSSTAYIFRDKITDEIWTSYPEGSYVIRTYDADKPYEVLKDVKIFGGFGGDVILDKYLGYLVLKDGKMYDMPDLTIFSGEDRVDTDNIDLNSIEQIKNNYFKDKNGIYSYTFSGEYSKEPDFQKVKDADEKTFQVLDENYAKDVKNVYYKNKKLNVKDIDGFKILKLWNTEPVVFTIGYSKDGVYYNGKKISNTALKGKVEIMGKTIFRDEKQVYIFREYDSKAKIEKRDIPVNARYTVWILDDENYYYDPYSDVKTAKSQDFMWLDSGSLFRNGGKIYFISPMFGIMESKFYTNTFKLVYNKNEYLKIASDKNGYYFYSGEDTGYQFQKIKNEKIKLLDNTENVKRNLFYNPENKKYYILLNEYKGDVAELTGIKHVSEILLDSYIIGK